MKQSGLGIASLVLGIIGMLLSCVVIGIVPSVIGLVLAIIGFTQKDRGHGTAIAGLVCSVIGISIFLFWLLVIGFSADESSTVSNVSSVTETTTNDMDSIASKEDDLAEQMEINEYSMENSIGDTYYILVIKNNSSVTVELSINAIAKDNDGKTIGATTASENAVGSGQEVCVLNYFDGVSDASMFEYTLSVKKDTYYDAVCSDLSVEESRTEEKVILTVTNNGSYAAEFVEAKGLFFSGGELVHYDSTYITDDDFEIKAGATISKELNCYKGYDDVKIFFSGRR